MTHEQQKVSEAFLLLKQDGAWVATVAAFVLLAKNIPETCPACHCLEPEPRDAPGIIFSCANSWHDAYPLARAILGEEGE